MCHEKMLNELRTLNKRLLDRGIQLKCKAFNTRFEILGEMLRRCVIIANCCVIIGIRAKSFTKVNSCRPHPQCNTPKGLRQNEVTP